MSTSIPPSLFKEVFHITGLWVLDAIGSALMSGYVMSSCFLTCCGRAPHQKATVSTPLFYRGPSPSLLFFFCHGAGGKRTAAAWCWSRWCFWEFPVWLQVTLQLTKNTFKKFKLHSFDSGDILDSDFLFNACSSWFINTYATWKYLSQALYSQRDTKPSLLWSSQAFQVGAAQCVDHHETLQKTSLFNPSSNLGPSLSLLF